jgi:hypothetical protein
MAATALIGAGATMVTPHRVTQAQIARIGGRTNHSTTHRTGGGAKGGITGRSTDRRTASRAKHGTTDRPITRIGTATRDEQGRRKTHHHCRAHNLAPIFVTMETHVAKRRFRLSRFTEKYCCPAGLRARDKGRNRASLRRNGGSAPCCLHDGTVYDPARFGGVRIRRRDFP